MTNELFTLLVAAASIGFFHTLLGPDHYLPFVAISKARNWKTTKTLLITLGCGIGHVAGSVALGLIGVALGTAVASLEFLEAIRGDIAAWVLLAFGLTYMVWGIRRVVKNKHHHHHLPGVPHVHNDDSSKRKNITPWVLFIVFVLGPCEPLIPLLIYPAAQENMLAMYLVIGVFSITTIGTMTLAVYLLNKGISLVRLKSLEKYSHALAGMVILLCGVAIFLGL
jgi:sulfite exporter TauE/SafE